MEFHKDLSLVSYYFYILCINDLPVLFSLFKLILFLDDAYLFTSFAEENARNLH